MNVDMLPSRKESMKRKRCSVYGCNSKLSDNLKLTFHAFPKKNLRYVYIKNACGEIDKIDQCQAWKNAVGIKKNLNEYMKVCSLHFKKEDYILPDFSTKRRLKTNAVPSCNLSLNHMNTPVEKNDKSLLQMNAIANKDDEINEIKKEVESSNNTVFLEVSDINMEQIYIKEEKIDFDDHCLVSEVALTKDVETQVYFPLCSNKLSKPKFTDFIRNDSDLNILTGIGSMKVLEIIIDIAMKSYKNHAKYGVDEMSLRDKIIMTYVKLKENISFPCLAVLFHCHTEQYCQQVFDDTLSLLSQFLEVAIIWPSKAEIVQNSPKCFEDFENLRVIIDCIEISIEQSTKPDHSFAKDYRNKTVHICRVIIGLTPAGNISFVSSPYNNKESYVRMLKLSNILDLMEPGDGIIADNKFKIDKLCNKKSCMRLKLSSLNNKKLIEAKAHLHSIKQVKTFEIVNHPVPVELAPRIQRIFTIICATINLTSLIVNSKNLSAIDIKTE